MVNVTKGIILAGGSGTRLSPITEVVSKQLLPIYSKPMIYYPIGCLMLAGIRDILIISTPKQLPQFEQLLGDGSQLGIKFSYAVQEQPSGLAEAFLIGEKFIGDDAVALCLGDNIFYGHGLSSDLRTASENITGARVFGYEVKDPERYGTVTFDGSKVIAIEEKPKNPRSNWAVTGLYFYDNSVVAKAKTLKPSARGELEITDINNLYLQEEKLAVVKMGRGYAWFDTGTFDSLLSASLYVQTIEERQGMMICCPEEIAYNYGYITKEQIENKAKRCAKNSYGRYLRKMIGG